MLSATMADLMAAQPHEAPDRRYTAAEWELYLEGYDYALLIAMRALEATERRYELIERTKRLEAKRKRRV